MLYLEDFDPDESGWVDRDSGEMTVNHDAGNDWMVGSYGASILPQNDAFRIDSGANFLGDFVTPGITQIRFQFYAVNVLPSDLLIRIIDGANTFTYQFSPLTGAFMNWETFTVNLAWSYGWNGLSEMAFNAALTSVDAVEIQVTRTGNGAQSYYLDNVETLNADLGGGGDSVIPEPTTVSIFIIALAFFIGIRRFVIHET